MGWGQWQVHLGVVALAVTCILAAALLPVDDRGTQKETVLWTGAVLFIFCFFISLCIGIVQGVRHRNRESKEQARKRALIQFPDNWTAEWRGDFPEGQRVFRVTLTSRIYLPYTSVQTAALVSANGRPLEMTRDLHQSYMDRSSWAVMLSMPIGDFPEGLQEVSGQLAVTLDDGTSSSSDERVVPISFFPALSPDTPGSLN